MNDRQTTAIAAPCAYSHETLRPVFRRQWNGFSSIVTVNK